MHEANTLAVLLKAAEASGLWVWLESHGFSRTHLPTDAELLKLARIASNENAPWNIRSYLSAALKLAA